MRVAVINEFSAMAKNEYIIRALEKQGINPLNIGMSEEHKEIDLSYINTGFMAATLLNLNLVDLVVGGCGTGQGFLISVMQYPNVFCGLIEEPLDAFLFSQINNGNCLSLALNKGFGWAGELNLDYIFEKLFEKTPGGGYPPERSVPQAKSREMLEALSVATHKPFGELIYFLDKDIIKTAMAHKPFYDQIKGCDQALAKELLAF
ncbi:MAG TPA: RpiB/LacA/LacB family sugar-phosphate isomerase [Oscillospiraceae bacterium]|nr:RpiB/LacA/LacB family sugar-phosphate isomerase [Oscillospiraceae bacterium]